MEIVGLAQSIPYAGSNGIFWFFIAFDLFGLALDVLGFFAVYRLIPEYMIAYGWALMALLVVNVIRFITWAVLGSFVGASVTLILQVLFTFSMTASELRHAKPTVVDPSVPVPTTFCDIPLRALILVYMSLFALMEIIGLAQSIPFAVRYSIFWWYITFDLLGLALNVFGFYSVYRLIPEYMIVYTWVLLVLLIVNSIRFITWMVLGNFIAGTVTLILQALFVFSMVGCIYALKAYALACRGIAV
ncbi:hypothetical protein CcCBS67573_g09196 [Chytriomyces confervae]|uniref:Uncharacterized protein n=1 Tax=Chytriomyces confervae TaxID=246404 RepID=A0A507E3S8_9FUNG|nr:hypothetical protein CcCBS67573_g09196 [Chytriomyces confervae]